VSASASTSPAVVVTGASSGIGREIARIAAREGNAVVLLGRSEQALAEVAAELKGTGVQVAALSVNLESPDAISRIEQLLAEQQLYCDVLVNSAGFGVYGPAHEADPTAQVTLVDVQTRALTALVLRFLPGMVARKRGGILNVGSITAYAPGPYMAAYCASKAFVRSFTAALAAEAVGTGVTVTCFAPGVVRTAFFDRCSVGQSRMFKILPRDNTVHAAEAAWRGYKAGRSVVTPRLIDRFVRVVCWLVPDRLLALGVAALNRPR
jgi:uncharacterized protein